MYHSPEGHGIGDLTMKPDILVRREKPCQFGTKDTDNVAKHGNKNETAIIGQDETSAS